MRRSFAPLNATLPAAVIPFFSDSVPVSTDPKSTAAQKPQPDDFAEQQVTRESYRFLRDQTQEALYREFPEARGHIEIYDATAKPETEFNRISHNLAFKSEADRAEFEKQFKTYFAKVGASGHVFSFTDHDGQRYGVALAWGPSKGDNNISIQKNLLHETNHCLDRFLNNAEFLQKTLGDEGLAEATAIKVVAENGLGQQWGNDYTAIYAQRGETHRHDSEGAFNYDIFGATPYLLSKASYNEQNSHYDGSIKGWRAAFAAISEIRNKNFPRELQVGFEIMQVAITDIYATNHFEKNDAAHHEWLKKISDLPEYQNIAAGENTLSHNAAFHYVEPSITPEVYQASIALLWKLHRNDPTDERVTHLLQAYRKANDVMPNQPLAKIENDLVKNGIVRQDMIIDADNAVKAELAPFRAVNAKAASAASPVQQTTPTAEAKKTPALSPH